MSSAGEELEADLHERRAHKLVRFVEEELPSLCGTVYEGLKKHHASDWLANFEGVPHAKYFAHRVISRMLYFPRRYVDLGLYNKLMEEIVWPRALALSERDGIGATETAWTSRVRRVIPSLQILKGAPNGELEQRVAGLEAEVSRRWNVHFAPEADAKIVLIGDRGPESVANRIEYARQEAGAIRRDADQVILLAHAKCVGLESSRVDDSIIAVHELMTRHEAFHTNSDLWQSEDQRRQAEDAISTVCNRYEIPWAPQEMKYHTYGVDRSFPSWSLPILSWEGPDWKPLFG